MIAHADDNDLDTAFHHDNKYDNHDNDDDNDDTTTTITTTTTTMIRANRNRALDRTACRTRQFSLGMDLVVTRFVGTMGFEEVTDWEYYYTTTTEEESDDDSDNSDNIRSTKPTKSTKTTQQQQQRQVVTPNPLDPSQPKRTRTKSGSVVRLFRGEFIGRLGATIAARGRDKRVWIKEFTGDWAVSSSSSSSSSLAQTEANALARMQSQYGIVENENDDDDDDDDATLTDWITTAAARSLQPRADDANVLQLLTKLSSAPFVGLLGEVYLAELEDDDEWNANEFYRALGVPPPPPKAVWFVYEYAGWASLQAYCAQPPQLRRAKLPRKRGFFNTIIQPPPLPSWNERTHYIQAIVQQAILAVATVHESGLVHRSIGRSSFLLCSTTMDKADAASIYATRPSQLTVKLTDFGFAATTRYHADSNPHDESTISSSSSWSMKTMEDDPEFVARARTFGLDVEYCRQQGNYMAAVNFAMAEDMHALGMVVLGLFLTALAELEPTGDAASSSSSLSSSSSSSGASFPPMPATDEDTLQRLFGDIFDKDVQQFRDYVQAEDVWIPLVEWLDENNGAGWDLLETLLTARERAAANKDSLQLLSLRKLLAHPFFTQR